MSHNTSRSIPASQPGTLLEVAPRPQKGQHRERDFGIGYGNSSGYGRATRYGDGWTGAPRFRCG